MSPSPPVQSNIRFLVGGAVIAAVVLGLVVYAMGRPGSQSFYMTPSELHEVGVSGPGSSYRVNGHVVPGSIDRRGLTTSFALTDGSSEIPVVTAEALPDTFKERAEVVARGTYDGSRFSAVEVLAKCPSKFKARA